MSKLIINRVNNHKPIPLTDMLDFGNCFTDHMFIMDYESGKGWHNAQIVPYDQFEFSPAATVLHYGQAIFEGVKAFRTEQDEIILFRVKDYLERLNRSADVLCIPHVDINMLHEGLRELINLDKCWVPNSVGTSLYIRPFVIATEPYLGIKVSDTYKLFVILSPVGDYYKEGFKPVSIKVEDKYVRAVHGGLGEAKTPANYAASLRAQEEAKQAGFAQVLWLDALERKYVEEVGTMNIFFKIKGEIVTPALTGSILGGITRRTVIEIAQEWGQAVTERKISIDEIFAAYEKGELEEAFGSGTAAVISPVGELSWQCKKIVINNNKTGEFSKRMFDYITSIQYGKLADKFGWVETVAKI